MEPVAAVLAADNHDMHASLESKHPDLVARCRSEARKDGIFAGLTSGLVSAMLGHKLFRFGRNTTIICGVVTGVLSGYQFSRAFMASNLARLQAELTARASVDEKPTELR